MASRKGILASCNKNPRFYEDCKDLRAEALQVKVNIFNIEKSTIKRYQGLPWRDHSLVRDDLIFHRVIELKIILSVSTRKKKKNVLCAGKKIGDNSET